MPETPTSNCGSCGAQLPQHMLLMSADGPICATCHASSADRASKSVLGDLAGILAVAAVAALIPFFVHVRSVVTVNGAITAYRDWVAILCGAAAAAIAAYGFFKALKGSGGAALLAPLALFGLGAFQLVRGFGLLAG
ncbi:MAG: hypothetical protein KC503_13540 [Myxococcales bacterium]|nr:hypothetical protein [Myxococcales bacterium]